MRVNVHNFAQNADTPGALEALGFDRFDSVTWFEGLEPGKEYQVQMWFDMNDNGELDSAGRWVLGTYGLATSQEDGGYHVQAIRDDYYYWQEPDLYSGIHTINTDPDAFNVDIDADGTMDFFIDADGTMDFFVEDNDHLDILIGGAYLVGGDGDDVLFGDDGDDQLYGGDGDDILIGYNGDDHLEGGAGDDSLSGNEGDDRLFGGAGDDSLYGGDDDDEDLLDGGDGDDQLDGGPGNDWLFGGDGDDEFSFDRRYGDLLLHHGNDTIQDFGNGSDTINLEYFAEISDVDDLTITQSDSNTVIDLSDHGGGTITLIDFTGALDDSDFIFAA